MGEYLPFVLVQCVKQNCIVLKTDKVLVYKI